MYLFLKLFPCFLFRRVLFYQPALLLGVQWVSRLSLKWCYLYLLAQANRDIQTYPWLTSGAYAIISEASCLLDQYSYAPVEHKCIEINYKYYKSMPSICKCYKSFLTCSFFNIVNWVWRCTTIQCVFVEIFFPGFFDKWKQHLFEIHFFVTM